MLRKLFSLSAVLIFAFSILFLSLEKASFGARPGLAAATLKFSVAPSEETTLSATPTPKEEYFLPYPGILPDNLLYKLKMVRDRVLLWLTREPVSRTNLLLHYADKRVGAGKALIEGGQAALGITTLTKGEKYLEKALREVQTIKEKGGESAALAEKIKNASAGHQQILTDLKPKVNSEGNVVLDELLGFLQTLQDKAQEL